MGAAALVPVMMSAASAGATVLTYDYVGAPQFCIGPACGYEGDGTGEYYDRFRGGLIVDLDVLPGGTTNGTRLSITGDYISTSDGEAPYQWTFAVFGPSVTSTELVTEALF